MVRKAVATAHMLMKDEGETMDLNSPFFDEVSKTGMPETVEK